MWSRRWLDKSREYRERFEGRLGSGNKGRLEDNVHGIRTVKFLS